MGTSYCRRDRADVVELGQLRRRVLDHRGIDAVLVVENDPGGGARHRGEALLEQVVGALCLAAWDVEGVLEGTSEGSGEPGDEGSREQPGCDNPPRVTSCCRAD
jgi:hypothetical protein